jgi:hypothetical protein
MRVSRRFWLFAVLSLLVVAIGPSVTSAQHAVRMSRPVLVRSRPAARNVALARPATLVSPLYNYGNGEGIFPGIGLGLGYGFYGTNQNSGINAAINPATQLRLAAAQRFLRDNRSILGYGGYYLLDGGGAYAVPTDEPAPEATPQQPQVIVLQQAPAQQPVAEQQSEAPIPDEGEFTLVLRGGKTIQVVAFTHTNDHIVYISADGGRHTIAADDLDSDATVRVNQERGTPLQLPL